MICPKCRDWIMYDTQTHEYFCSRTACAFRESFDEYQDTLKDINITLSRSLAIKNAESLRSRTTRRDWKSDLADVVYYIQFRDAIKIGTSRAVSVRLADLPWEYVLALEPGDRGLESAMHKKFSEHRLHGEWFLDVPDIRQHVEGVVQAQIDSGWTKFRYPNMPNFPWPRSLEWSIQDWRLERRTPTR